MHIVFVWIASSARSGLVGLIHCSLLLVWNEAEKLEYSLSVVSKLMLLIWGDKHGVSCLELFLFLSAC